MDGLIKSIGMYAGLLVLIAGVSRGCNVAFNNRTINNQAYHTESRATGLNGHIEYTRYKDGSQDVKIYPSWGHRMFSSELHQDLNGDGLIDRIRQDGPEWKDNRLNTILVRKFDYQQNKARFDKADKELNSLMNKYPQGAK
jgi:hypothetical protein